jgi:aldehyde dehydrogenase (NAD+)
MTGIPILLKSPKAFFRMGQTLDAGFRRAQLDTLQSVIGANQDKILAALKQDLAKSAYEGCRTEVGIVRSEIRPLRYPPFGNKLALLKKMMR